MYKLIYLARRNPTVNREDWPETWRSHATFANQFAFIANDIKYSRYSNRIDTPALDGKPVDIPILSKDHDGVAQAFSETVDTLKGGGFSKEERGLIDKDELRVFDMLTPEFSFYCTEQRIKDGALAEYGVYRFLARKPGLSREAFDARLNGEHAEVARNVTRSLDCVTRYAHNNPIHDALPLFPFDAITECWSASQDDAVRTLLDPKLAPLVEDLALFCDTDRGVTILTHSYRRRGVE